MLRGKSRVHVWYFNPVSVVASKTEQAEGTRPLVLRRDRMPELLSTDGHDDPVAKIKLYDPTTQSAWYLVEYDYTTQLAYGLAVTDEFPEGKMGYIHVSDLRSMSLPMGLRISRDIHYLPKKISEVQAEEKAMVA